MPSPPTTCRHGLAPGGERLVTKGTVNEVLFVTETASIAKFTRTKLGTIIGTACCDTAEIFDVGIANEHENAFDGESFAIHFFARAKWESLPIWSFGNGSCYACDAGFDNENRSCECDNVAHVMSFFRDFRVRRDIVDVVSTVGISVHLWWLMRVGVFDIEGGYGIEYSSRALHTTLLKFTASRHRRRLLRT